MILSAGTWRMGNIRRHVLSYITLIVATGVILFPIGWLITSTVKPASEIYTIPPRLLGSRLTGEHYLQVLGDPRMIRYFLNSILVSSITTALAVAVGLLAGYGFSRFSFKSRQSLYFFVLGCRMLPVPVLILPLYFLFVQFYLLDSNTGLVVAYMARSLPLGIWLFTNFLNRIPPELDQAAMIDGCNRLQVLAKVIVPNMGPSILAVGVYMFLLSWNEYLLPLVLVQSQNLRPISVGLSLYMQEHRVYWGPLLAGSLLMSVGPMLFFTIFHRFLAFGLSEGSVKG